MTAHRYWRVWVYANHGDTTVGIDEVDLRVSAAGPRLSITGNGTSFASSVYPGIYTHSGAFDGLPFTVNPSTTGWLSASPGTGFNFPHWVAWDFGSGNEQDINYLALTNLNLSDSAATASVKNAVLQYSDDLVTWHSHIFIANHPNGTGQTVAYELVDFRAIVSNRYTRSFFSLDPTDPAAMVVSAHRNFRDFEFDGKARIFGTVKIDGDPDDMPVRRRVRLFRDRDGLMVRQAWSDLITGNYAFESISENYKYSVIVYDYQHSYRAVIADNVTPDT